MIYIYIHHLGIDGMVFWAVYMRLLQDEDVDVRQTTSAALEQIQEYVDVPYQGTTSKKLICSYLYKIIICINLKLLLLSKVRNFTALDPLLNRLLVLY